MSDRREAEEETPGGGSAVKLDDPTDESSEANGHEASDDTVATDGTDDDADEATSDDDDSDDDATHVVDTDDDSDDDDTDDADDADEDEDDDRGPSRAPLIAAVAVAAGAVIAVLVLLAAFVWPDFTGPGKPDDAANQAVAAISSKDAGRVDAASCRRSDGQTAATLPPEALPFIQSAVPTGPARIVLTSEARQPMNLTLNVGGQARTLPAEIVLAVNDGAWCMNSLAGQAQQ